MLPSYNQTISSIAIPRDELQNLTKYHQRKLKPYYWTLWISLALTVLVIIFAYLVDYENNAWFILFPIITVIAGILLWMKHSNYTAEFKHRFKQLIVGPFANKMVELSQLPNETEEYEKYCKYYPSSRIDDNWIRKSELFDVRIDDITGEDLFSGKLGLTEFEFCELHMTREETSIDAKGKTTKTTVTVFDGVLFIADFKKHFSGLTIVETNAIKSASGVGKFFGKIVNGLSSTASRKVNRKIKLESEEFNRYFTVETTDEIEARYILSSKLMEQILNFEKKYKSNLQISFSHSSMFIALSSSKNFFDKGVSKTNQDYNIEGIYEDLYYFFSMIEEFSLNTRIWSKQ